jgi:hypothetical protein
MTALKTLKEMTARKGSRFPQLDGDGASSWTADRETVVGLLASAPDGGARDSLFHLHTPLLSLSGLDLDVARLFLLEALALNIPGRLPQGMCLFYFDDDAGIYLGGQHSAEGMDGAAFDALTDLFLGEALALRRRLLETLADLSGPGGGEAAPSPQASGAAGSEAGGTLEDILRRGQNIIPI